MSERDLPDRVGLSEARGVIATGFPPSDDSGHWAVSWALDKLMLPADPTDPNRAHKKEHRFKLSQLIPPDASIQRAKEHWLVGNQFWDPTMLVEGKTWDDHRRALYQSDPRRDHYNVKLAILILQGDDSLVEDLPSFPGLNAKQRIKALRMYRNRDDYRDRAVTAAVRAELKGQASRGFTTIITAVERRADEKLAEMEAADKAGKIGAQRKIFNDFHMELLRTTNAAYQLKHAYQDAPPEIRTYIRQLLLGSTIAVTRALEDLGETLVSD